MAQRQPFTFQLQGVCVGVSATKDGSRIFARFPCDLPADAPRDSEEGSLGLEVSPEQASKLAVGRVYRVTGQFAKYMEKVDYKKGGGGMHDRYAFLALKFEPVEAGALAGAK